MGKTKDKSLLHQSDDTKTNGKKKRPTWIPLVLIMIAGIIILLYPTIADQWNRVHGAQAIATYLDQTDLLSKEDKERIIEEAKQYNRELAWGSIAGDAQERYYNSLSVDGSTIMSYIIIEKIDCTIPIYHGTDEAILEVAAGHLDWSSLPVGAASYDNETGKVADANDGSHTVISGHRGLVSAKLFTDLDKLEVGDSFILRTLDEVLGYEVDQIRTVLPEDLSELQIEKGYDYCSLVTCTPYGVNTHRLLVRGHRVPADSNMFRVYSIQGNAAQIQPMIVAPILAAPVLVILFILAMVLPGRRRNKKNSIDENIIEDLEIADLPLQKLDLSVIEINRLLEASRKANRAEKKSGKNKDDQNENNQNENDLNENDS